MSRSLSLRVLTSATVAMITIGSLGARAESRTELQWRQFHANPQAFMNLNPVKFDANGHVLKQRQPRFPVPLIKNGQFIEIKDAFRRGEDRKGRPLGARLCNKSGVCVKDILDGRAGAIQNVAELLDTRELKATKGRIIRDVEEMQNLKLLEARLAETPWSDSYWPIAEGILGQRYASPAFQNGNFLWSDYFEFISKDNQSLMSIYKRGNNREIDSLSPSEKYDLLIGPLQHGQRSFKNGYLTPAMWKEGKAYWDSRGEVESWMGICHGWAPAAFMVPRPTHAITVKAADGRTDLTFYPSDLKGLASYLWAKAPPPMRFLGGRCNDKDARRDENTGRILDEDCFDTNPGNWHIAIVNQIGIAKRSFVMDATFDYEVWNQPVYSYSYSYFNPETGKETASLKNAVVRREDFKKDKFKRFRSGNARYVVGISMDVTYVVETDPSQAETDSAKQDALTTVSYMYDLELDAKLQIIGGEWYSNHHPDFLWLPEADAHATTVGDARLGGRQTENWDVSEALPKFWSDIAIATATRTGQPLAAVVERMIGASMVTKPTTRSFQPNPRHQSPN